jgi:hypothetical protein
MRSEKACRLFVALICGLTVALAITQTGSAEPLAAVATPTPAARVHLPLILKPSGSVTPPACPTTSTNSYSQGPATQLDHDNPVRPAAAHADKNFALRGYVANTDASLRRELVDYGSASTQPPQFATLFSPNRVPLLVGFYRVYDWIWSPSPAPGSRGAPLTRWHATALGLQVSPGETLHVPTSAYDIGEGGEVIVLHADERRVALHYTREDSAAGGYTVHIEGLCTDPKLLALYNQLNAANGPRYVFPASQYRLPVLPAGQPIGWARGSEVVVAIVDSGEFMDPRSCNEWWQIRPGYTGTCPPHELSALAE